MDTRQRIPLTIITGFLGAGKTTLVNALLGHLPAKTGIVVNEFGRIDIDSILFGTAKENIRGIADGCACCSVLTDVADAILAMAFQGCQHIILETSGVADPAPIVATVLSTRELAERVVLRGIVCTVDARCGYDDITRRDTCRNQLRYADHVVLTKVDCVDDYTVADVEGLIGVIAPGASIHRSSYADVGETLASLLLYDQAPTLKHDDGPVATHDHLDDITSVSVRINQAVDRHAVSALITLLAATLGASLYRLKGVITLADDGSRIVVHGVHGMYGWESIAATPQGQQPSTTLVLIGCSLSAEHVHSALASAALLPESSIEVHQRSSASHVHA